MSSCLRGQASSLNYGIFTFNPHSQPGKGCFIVVSVAKATVLPKSVSPSFLGTTTLPSPA